MAGIWRDVFIDVIITVKLQSLLPVRRWLIEFTNASDGINNDYNDKDSGSIDNMLEMMLMPGTKQFNHDYISSKW